MADNQTTVLERDGIAVGSAIRQRRIAISNSPCHREPANELCPYCWRRFPSANGVEAHIGAKHPRVAYPRDDDESRMRRYHERKIAECKQHG